VRWPPLTSQPGGGAGPTPTAPLDDFRSPPDGKVGRFATLLGAGSGAVRAEQGDVGASWAGVSQELSAIMGMDGGVSSNLEDLFAAADAGPRPTPRASAEAAHDRAATRDPGAALGETAAASADLADLAAEASRLPEPQSPETLLDAIHRDEEEGDTLPQPFVPGLASTAADGLLLPPAAADEDADLPDLGLPDADQTRAGPHDDESEASDIDADPQGPGLGGLGGLAALGGAAQEPLPDEPWMSRPLREREMWERLRPRALRREAQQLRALRLPNATVSRLMKLNPNLTARSSEAQDIITHATTLLVQAVAKAAARGKEGQKVTFKDVREVCKQAKELHFLHPLQGSLDDSARTTHRHIGEADGEEGDAAAGRRGAGGNAGQTVKKGGAQRAGAAPLPAEQSLLGAFARSTAAPAEAPAADGRGRSRSPPPRKPAAEAAAVEDAARAAGTPEAGGEPSSRKRKQQTPNTSVKAPPATGGRRKKATKGANASGGLNTKKAAEKVAPGASLANFFSRVAPAAEAVAASDGEAGGAKEPDDDAAGEIGAGATAVAAVAVDVAASGG